MSEDTLGEFIEALGLSEKNKDFMIRLNPPITANEIAISQAEALEAEECVS